MKLRQTFATILLVLVTGFVALAQGQFSINESPLPAPTGMVNDYANIIDDGVQAQIEQKLRDFKAKTNPNIEIAVVTVRTTGERPIFDYSLAVARGWGIGDKGATNSSALLLVAVDDRKYFTQVSGGLQDELTDGIIGQLQRQNLVPAFKQGNYTKGISDTIDAYIHTIEERNNAPVGVTPTPSSESGGGMPFGCYVLICLVVIVIILIIIFARGGSGGGGGSGSNRDRWRSGGFGGNTSNNNSSFIPPVVIWGGGGDSSSSSDWGSSSSGGDSWGGFGGGGGGFDGGGAGGDW